MTRGRIIAAVLAVVVASAGGAAVISRDAPDSDYKLTAYFDRAIGLFPRSTVRILGVEVGRVTEVKPTGDRVRVGMRIDGEVRVPREASAVLVPISLISDRYVQLGPVYRGGAFLKDGDEIPLSRGVAPRELDDLLATLKNFLEALEPGTPDSPGALGQLVVNADQALAGNGQELGTTIEGLSTLLDVLARNAAHFDSTLVSLDELLGVLGRKDAELAATNRGLRSVFGVLREERGRVESGVRNLADLLDQLGDLVRQHRSDLQADLEILKNTTQVLTRQQEGLIRNIRWLPVLAQGTHQAFDAPLNRIHVRDNQGVRFTP